MRSKPTVVLDEKDVVAFSEMANARAQSVGIPAPDASDMWKSWSASYIAILKLRETDTSKHAANMLEEIYGVTTKIKEE